MDSERVKLNLGRVIVNAIKNSKLSKLQQQAAIVALAAAGALNVVTAGDAAYDSIVRAVKDKDCSCFIAKYGNKERYNIKKIVKEKDLVMYSAP